MMAQAGATFNKRGPHRRTAAGPSVRAIGEEAGGAPAARSSRDVEAATCNRVFATSAGVVRSAASAPAPRPATADRSADNDGSSAVRYHVGVNTLRKLSKPAQYKPEKGTSRHSVGARPRQSVPKPRWRTLSRKTEK